MGIYETIPRSVTNGSVDTVIMTWVILLLLKLLLWVVFYGKRVYIRKTDTHREKER